jgi:hypothetical protein
MQFLKIGLILGFVSSLCSFAYYSAQEDSRGELYKSFLSQFEQVNIPSTVTLKAYIVTNKTKPKKQKEQSENRARTSNLLGNEYAPFIPGISRGKMSRMGPSRYKAELALTTTGKYSAVVYSRSHSFDGEGKSYLLATFDGNGAPVATQYLGYASLEEEVELAITKKMELTTKSLLAKGVDKEFEEEIQKIFITPKGEILVHGEDDLIEEVEPVQKKATLKFS